MLTQQLTHQPLKNTTPLIFEKYNTPEDFANIDLTLLENLIHPCGFYKNKAKNIKSTATILLNNYNSIVPNNIEDLIALPGVGRKTANVVMLEAFNIPKIELDLLKTFPKEYYKDINHIFIYFGRDICTARKPKCNICPINKFCKNFSKNE